MTPGGTPRHPSHGCSASAPGDIPVRHWGEILRRVGPQVMGDQLPLLSAGVAFFAVLSIAPVLVTALSVYAAVNSPAQALKELSGVVGLLPGQLRPVVADQVVTIADASTRVTTPRGVIGLLFALSTATTAANYLVDALTLAYHETETRSLWRRTGLALALVLSGALLLGALMAGVGAGMRRAENASPAVQSLAHALAWVGLGAVMAVVLAVLYRLAPDRRPARWCWVSWGATVATVLWLATSYGLSLYVQHMSTYESTYGSLAGVAISMIWLWITVLLVVVGAVVNAEAERQTSADSTVGPERPLGERRAAVADSAPPYRRAS
jgi:membrane protein